MEKVKEFVLDSEGHCFFCPSSPNSFSEHEVESTCPSFTPIHCFTRYLGMDMRKVFTENGTIQSSKSSNVERPQLTVELCEDCAATIEEFSKLYEQFEKIELEMGFYLKRIQEKLASAEGNKMTEFNSMPELKGNQEIVELLRTETLENCNSKLCKTTPTVKVQNLTPTQLAVKREKLKNSKFEHQNRILNPEEASSISNQDWGSDVEILPEVDHNNVDQITNEEECNNNNDPPFQGGNPEADDHNLDKTPSEGECNDNDHDQPLRGNSYVDPEINCEETSLSNSKHRRSDVEMDDSSKETPHEGEANANDEPFLRDRDIDPEISCEETSQRHDSMSAGDQLRSDRKTKLKTRILPATKITPSDISSANMKYQSTFDRKSDKHKCGICSKEYLTRKAVWRHHNVIHLNVRYKCRLCRKDFSQKSIYNEHFQSAHLGVQLKCKICNKMLAQSGSLWRHRLACQEKLNKSSCKLRVFKNTALQNRSRLQLNDKGVTLCNKISFRKGNKHDPGVAATSPVEDFDPAPLNEEDNSANDFDQDNTEPVQNVMDVDPTMTLSSTVSVSQPCSPRLVSFESLNHNNMVSATTTETSKVTILTAKENPFRCIKNNRLRKRKQDVTAAAPCLQKKTEELVTSHEEVSNKDKTMTVAKSTIHTDNVEKFRSKLRTVYRCLKCSKTFPTAVRLEEHRKSEGCGCFNEKQAPSNINNRELKTIDEANISKRTITNAINEGKQFISFGKVRSINPKTGKHKCDHCSKEFTRSSRLRVHLKTFHHINVRYNCNFLYKTYKGQQTDTNTATSRTFPKSANDRRKPSCRVCGKIFQQAFNVQRHFKSVHLRLRDYGCELCASRFKLKDTLQQHHREVHLGIKRKQ